MKFIVVISIAHDGKIESFMYELWPWVRSVGHCCAVVVISGAASVGVGCDAWDILPEGALVGGGRSGSVPSYLSILRILFTG